MIQISKRAAEKMREFQQGQPGKLFRVVIAGIG
jgi:Fe-S cluster assembly iron-binding protein IscA